MGRTQTRLIVYLIVRRENAHLSLVGSSREKKKMQAVVAKLSKSRTRSHFHFLTRTLTTLTPSSPLSNLLSSPSCDATNTCLTRRTLLTTSPWSATQHRGARVQGADVSSYRKSLSYDDVFDCNRLLPNHNDCAGKTRKCNTKERYFTIKTNILFWIFTSNSIFTDKIYE